jgi:hypothetical protein
MGMIRHIVLFTLKPTTTTAQVEDWISAVQALPTPGLVAFTWGLDLGLREGNASMAAVFDFVDEGAYLAWYQDRTHDHIRREMMQPLVAHAARCQYRID